MDALTLISRAQFVQLCNQKLKLVRTEHSFNQEEMALMLGISKKTLVEIEKGRSSLGWAGSIALCTVFCDSEIVSNTFGSEPVDIIRAIAFADSELPQLKKIGSSIFWQTIREERDYCIQQNIISQHYRLLDGDGNSVAAAFNLEDLEGAEGMVS